MFSLAMLGLTLLPGEEEEIHSDQDEMPDQQYIQNGGHQLGPGNDDIEEVEEDRREVQEVDGPLPLIWNGEEWLRQED